jgi:hypothetical protein
MPFSQLYSDWVAANAASWQPQQFPIANALMNINVQVRKEGRRHVDTLFGGLKGSMRRWRSRSSPPPNTMPFQW